MVYWLEAEGCMETGGGEVVDGIDERFNGEGLADKRGAKVGP